MLASMRSAGVAPEGNLRIPLHVDDSPGSEGICNPRQGSPEVQNRGICRPTKRNLCRQFLPPANEVCEGYVFTGVCLSTPGGACMVLFGGCGFIRGACMVLFGGGCVHGFIRGACVVLFGGGTCVVFSVFLDTMRYGQWVGGTHPTGMHSCKKSKQKDYYT